MKTSMPPLKEDPPIIMSHNSTKEKSKTPSLFNIGHVASFIAKLRGKAIAMHIPVLMGPYGPALLFDSEGTPINN